MNRSEYGILIVTIQGVLRDEHRYKRWQGHPNPLAGQCYVATEALFYLGAKDDGFRPFNLKHEDTSHWCLTNNENTVMDPTVGQFVTVPDYTKGRRRGFQTGYNRPSWRAQHIINAVQALMAPPPAEGAGLEPASRVSDVHR